jgi:hypothetical protein
VTKHEDDNNDKPMDSYGYGSRIDAVLDATRVLQGYIQPFIHLIASIHATILSTEQISLFTQVCNVFTSPPPPLLSAPRD